MESFPQQQRSVRDASRDAMQSASCWFALVVAVHAQPSCPVFREPELPPGRKSGKRALPTLIQLAAAHLTLGGSGVRSVRGRPLLLTGVTRFCSHGGAQPRLQQCHPGPRCHDGRREQRSGEAEAALFALRVEVYRGRARRTDKAPLLFPERPGCPEEHHDGPRRPEAHFCGTTRPS